MTSATGVGVAAPAVLIAFLIDVTVGEPPARWHPVVWAGRWLSGTGAPWNHVTPRAAFARGALFWTAGACIGTAAAAALSVLIPWVVTLLPRPAAPAWQPALAALLLGLCLKPLLSWQMLHDEVAAVERALVQDLRAGRARLAHLVSRDTTALSAQAVRESALESLAENLNDSLVAPLFWFALAGLPGAALYRFANTADAMWGYRGRWEWAGKWAARADDVLSYVPARLTAALLALSALHWPRHLPRNAALTPSPNGGWPMAMLALALDVRLGKPGVYLLHPHGREIAPRDMQRGLTLCTRTAAAAVLLAAAAAHARSLAATALALRGFWP